MSATISLRPVAVAYRVPSRRRRPVVRVALGALGDIATVVGKVILLAGAAGAAVPNAMFWLLSEM